MEIGIKQAKNDLSRLIEKAQSGERAFVTKRGSPVIELVPVRAKRKKPAALRGYGMFRDVITLPPDWHTQEIRDRDAADVEAMVDDLA
jgi:prevent-host-death family protein